MIHQSNLAPSYECHFCPSCGYNFRKDEDVSIGPLAVGLLTGATWWGWKIKLNPQQLYALHTIASARGSLVRHDALQQRCDCTREHVGVLVYWIRSAFREIDPYFDAIENAPREGFRWKGERRLPEPKPTKPESKGISSGHLRISLATGCLWKGQHVSLTPQRLKIAHTIASARGCVVTFDELGEFFRVRRKNDVEAAVCHIRRAFRKVDPTFNHIKNEYGAGFRWRASQ